MTSCGLGYPPYQLSVTLGQLYPRFHVFSHRTEFMWVASPVHKRDLNKPISKDKTLQSSKI